MSSYDGKEPRTAPWVPQAAPPEPASTPQAGAATATTPRVSFTKEQPQVGPRAGPPPAAPPPVHPFTAPPPASSGRSAWLVLVALLLVGALGAGAWFLLGASDDSGPTVVADSGPDATVPDPDQAAAQEDQGETRPDRPVGSLRPEFVSAGCQALPGEDSVGNTITYEPALTLDGVPGTAWRCPGAAGGQRVAFDFGREVTLTSVGLIPGYAKVDPFDGTDRFLENRTVTRVVWEFDDGTRQVQTFSLPRPALDQFVLEAPVTTRQVVLEIVTTGNDTAVRDFTAISEVAFEGY